MVYFADSEFRFCLLIQLGVAVFVILALYFTGSYHDFWEAAAGPVQAVSIGTTAGFTTADFSIWPGFVAITLLFTSFVGLRRIHRRRYPAIRFLLLVKQGLREINRLIHPNAQIPIRVGSKVSIPGCGGGVGSSSHSTFASFTFMYIALAMTGLNLMTAFLRGGRVDQ